MNPGTSCTREPPAPMNLLRVLLVILAIYMGWIKPHGVGA